MMAKFRIDKIGELARQLAFSPREARLAQIGAAEELLHLIDPAKAYPPEFIVYRITGYRPRRPSGDLYAGIALQHDLSRLIEHLSLTLNQQTTELSEPVLSIDDVTEKFNITSKTIQRWRRKGLPSRRLIFPDGKRRVGFLLSSVERFFAAHGRQLADGVNLSRVEAAETREIVARALRLAAAGGCCVRELARRIGRRLNRSPLTILHTLRKFDQESPRRAVLPLAATEMSASQRDAAIKAFRRGMSLRQIARRLRRRRSEIYRAILDQRIERLSHLKMRFIDDPLYHGRDASAAIEAIAAQREIGGPDDGELATRMPRDLPPSLSNFYHTPLLTPSRERALFLKFNFHKSQFVALRRRLDPQYAGHRDLCLLEDYLRQAAAVKNAIVGANLRLVVSIARKHLRPGLSLMELVSDGNLTLMRAAESFDIHRGNRFSTYATLALMKGLARSVPRMSAERAGGRFDLDQVADRDALLARERWLARDQVQTLLRQLDPCERSVVQAHFGLEGQATSTYSQVAQRLGISRQRVVQIEQSAIAKLRSAHS